MESGRREPAQFYGYIHAGCGILATVCSFLILAKVPYPFSVLLSRNDNMRGVSCIFRQ